MSRRTNAAARIQPLPVASVRSGKRIRTTLGELIAAAYDAAGPGARPDDVARLLGRIESEAQALPAYAIVA